VAFLCAFATAMLTAFSYLELVTKYPRAAGAALYTHKAFNIHFITFVVAFAVMSSGLTSASSASEAFASNLSAVFDLGFGVDSRAITLIGFGFMALIALVNFRGVGESVKANVVLTCVELSGLLIIILIGMWALGAGTGDFGRVMEFDVSGGTGIFGAITAGTALAFFAMVGFEDSVNMAEETKDPVRIFPKIMISGLCITGLIYVLVSITAVALVSPGDLSQGNTPLLQVVEVGAPAFPLQIFGFITMFAVANSALINMLMASRLLYGMAREEVLPGGFGKVHRARRTPWVAILFTTAVAFGLIWFADLEALGGTTALLLLCVFTVVNIAVLVLRRSPVEHRHFRAPTAIPVIGAVVCFFLATPWSGRAPEEYRIAGVLLVVGVVLWALTWIANRALRQADVHAPPRRPRALTGAGHWRQNVGMETAHALDFIRRHHRAVIVTSRSDGRPQTSPVLAVVDGGDRVVVSTRETAMKAKHVRREPRVALCVFTDRFFGSWVQVEGEAEIISLTDAMDGLVDYYRRAVGEHDDWDSYRTAMQQERRCLLRLAVHRAGPSVSG
ncbi:MAG TPA: amino acid permease, partial [Nocardioidaceae bacterium]|nr:amino acid permease [Nocardioidaceae bacterium]